jgi:hypothetical protein
MYTNFARLIQQIDNSLRAFNRIDAQLIIVKLNRHPRQSLARVQRLFDFEDLLEEVHMTCNFE